MSQPIALTSAICKICIYIYIYLCVHNFVLQKKQNYTRNCCQKGNVNVYIIVLLKKAPGTQASPYTNQCIHDIPMPKSLPYILLSIYQYSQLHLEFTGQAVT